MAFIRPEKGGADFLDAPFVGESVLILKYALNK